MPKLAKTGNAITILNPTAIEIDDELHKYIDFFTNETKRVYYGKKIENYDQQNQLSFS